VIITSATLDTEKFSAAFGHSPVVSVEGRTYPVEVEYLPIDPDLEEAGDLTTWTWRSKPLTASEKKNGMGHSRFHAYRGGYPRDLRAARRPPVSGHDDPSLFARLPASEQGRVYSVSGSKSSWPPMWRRPLSLSRIRYVIDTGLPGSPSTFRGPHDQSPYKPYIAEQRRPAKRPVRPDSARRLHQALL